MKSHVDILKKILENIFDEILFRSKTKRAEENLSIIVIFTSGCSGSGGFGLIRLLQ